MEETGGVQDEVETNEHGKVGEGHNIKPALMIVEEEDAGVVAVQLSTHPLQQLTPMETQGVKAAMKRGWKRDLNQDRRHAIMKEQNEKQEANTTRKSGGG
ncbi:UDP-N-acetylglucosamine--N-acetylmuramyl-(pentapeptide) pyrophosphoryl-undecaprenol N-acetylglucosaminetransferase [Striga asiatica]|uniref:UDP-N-acetylglucosamine--N-acetylmuramyl-(Pentapeptide) pyrophosphoryl-undecaprenol N-acetylglucosaminetransferase n=1 Tax=Striga asiatica TaxID=4170 RepID=A0A5A7P5M8_STRAF|nr:UDP-N-acetylglucosamine--N-acetylmuramyl-(pentapeptide) pyrophosphoryl-undecaprenol N-acetylglucosaminetransferase [Striga asiatica]